MKKFNPNSILLIFASTFIFAGAYGGHYFSTLKSSTIELFTGIMSGDNYDITNFKTKLDDLSSKELRYHDALMNLDSIRNNLLGTKVIKKEDTTVVKADSGSLIEPKRRIEEEEIQKAVSRINDLKNVAEENGAKFLYCAAPNKEYYEIAPTNVENYSCDNIKRFITAMKNENIPVLDFTEELANDTNTDDMFYYTDHHWTTRSGFVATKEICESLKSLYGFSFNEKYTDLNNYSISEYSNWFLGSTGKKVGAYFTWNGPDDFELITPNFETDICEEQPFKDQIRDGAFEETVLFMDQLKKDYYQKNTYTTYSGGDFRLQILKNNLNPDGKKILIVRDSFACVVTPFLALQTSELHVCDVRNYEYYVGDKLNMKDYIQEFKPDYVLVLYSGVTTVDGSSGKFDFF